MIRRGLVSIGRLWVHRVGPGAGGDGLWAGDGGDIGAEVDGLNFGADELVDGCSALG